VSVVAPREAPQSAELEALIREARERQRRRRMGLAAVVAFVAATGLAIWSVVPGSGKGLGTSRGSGNSVAPSHRCPPGDLGSLAFVRGGALELLDLNGCRVRTLVRSHVHAPVSMSPDGQWVAFRDGYTAVRGGPVRRLPGTAVWSPSEDLFAVVTSRGGLELGRPSRRERRLLPDGWGAWGATFSPNGRRLAISRTADRGRIEEIWLLDLATGSRRELFREPRREGAPPLLDGFSPDDRWLLFWKDVDASASALADGVPLLALPVAGGRPRIVTKGELYFRDFLGWCGGSLVHVTDHGGRAVTQGDGIAVSTPPGWQSRMLLRAGGRTSWTSFSCGPAETLAVAAGPSNDDEPFGQEQRSIWLVHGAKSSVLAPTHPPRGMTDEWPSWSVNGKWLLFVRTRLSGHSWPGSLFALDLASRELVGPIARVGATENYYGHYAWTSQLSWHRP
jgi:Tol biopolymer transport system component